MLNNVFYWLLNMSIAAAICGGIVLLIRRIKKIPRRVTILLWLFPFLRMCLPVMMSGKYGLMAFISKFTAKAVPVFEFNRYPDFSMMNYVRSAESYFPVTYRDNSLEKVFSVCAFIWISAAGLLLLLFLISYITALKEIKNAVLLKENIYVSDKIKVPAVYGIIKPKIILPYDYCGSNLNYILLHEKTHIKRCDNFFRVLALVIVCIHWFNPLCWLFLKLFYCDMELACDEIVLSKCDEEERKGYAHALLSAIEKNSLFASPFGGVKLRNRIENILSYKKLSVFAAICLSIMIAAVAYILLTNA